MYAAVISSDTTVVMTMMGMSAWMIAFVSSNEAPVVDPDAFPSIDWICESVAVSVFIYLA